MKMRSSCPSSGIFIMLLWRSTTKGTKSTKKRRWRREDCGSRRACYFQSSILNLPSFVVFVIFVVVFLFALSDKLRYPHACPNRDQTKRDATYGIDRCQQPFTIAQQREGFEGKT